MLPERQFFGSTQFGGVRKMRKAIFVVMPVLLATHLFVYPAAAQFTPGPTPTPTPRASPTPSHEPKPIPCPRVAVQAQAGRGIRDGQPITFMANIAGGDPKVQPTIVWNVSAGVITDGHYSRRIIVDTTGAGETYDREIKAEVWVGGYAPECMLQATAAVKIIPAPRKFGDFGELPAETVTFHMKTLAKYLSESPDNLFVIGYAGRNSERGFTAKWLARMRSELTAEGIPARRIGIIDGGFREEPLFDFWIVAIGAQPPRPTPTIDRRQIVNRGTRPPSGP